MKARRARNGHAEQRLYRAGASEPVCLADVFCRTSPLQAKCLGKDRRAKGRDGIN